MTVFEYLQQLPQDLFEATLMGLMGIPMEENVEAFFHEWMNKPYDQYFPSVEKISGLDIEKMLEQEQENLRRSLIGYCEVCDRINQSLAEKQRTVNDG